MGVPISPGQIRLLSFLAKKASWATRLEAEGPFPSRADISMVQVDESRLGVNDRALPPGAHPEQGPGEWGLPICREHGNQGRQPDSGVRRAELGVISRCRAMLHIMFSIIEAVNCRGKAGYCVMPSGDLDVIFGSQRVVSCGQA